MSSTPDHESATRGASGRLFGALGLAVGLVLVAQILTLGQFEGYQLADSVEYLDRAASVARGEPLDPSTARSFAFSALLVPIAALGEYAGLPPAAVIALARAMQIAFACLALVVVGRTAARGFGRETGSFGWYAVCGALALGLQPVFLRWSVTPLAASASALFVALAFARLERTRRASEGLARAGAVAGLWFGASILVAYQNFLLLFAAVPVLLIAGPWRRLAHLVGFALGILAMLLAQGVLDWATYGSFASSLLVYLEGNVIGSLVRVLHKLGFTEQGYALYDLFFAEIAPGESSPSARPLRSIQPETWYQDQLLVVGMAFAFVALLVAGALRSLVRPNWFATLVVIALAANVAVMTTKGAKSYRLWMPLMPLFAWLATYGAAPLIECAASRVCGARRLLARGALAALLLFGAVEGARVLGRENLRTFGDYWRAIDHVSRVSSGAEGPVRVASAYDWGVRWRQPAFMELRKLPHHLDRWDDLDDAQRQELLASLADLDWFLAHWQTVTQDPAIVAALNERFEIAESFHDQEHAIETGPVLVLRRRTGAERARTFYEVFRDTGPGEANEPGAYQARIQHPISVDYRRVEPDGTLQMVLLGFDVEPGACGGDQAWVTLHWYAGPLAGRDFTIVSRFTDGRGGAWQDNHDACYGAHPTSSWEPGTIVRETRLSLIRWNAPGAPGQTGAPEFGGAWRRGDAIPIQFWLAIASFDENGAATSGLNPFRSSAAGPISKRPVAGGFASDQGRRWSADGLFQAGGFDLAVPALRRLPDDGRTLAELPQGTPQVP